MRWLVLGINLFYLAYFLLFWGIRDKQPSRPFTCSQLHAHAGASRGGGWGSIMFLPFANLYLPQVWESLGKNQPKITEKVKTSESSIKTGAGSMHIAKMCHSPGLPYAVASGDGVCSASTSDEAAKGSVATTTRYFSKVVASAGMRQLSIRRYPTKRHAIPQAGNIPCCQSPEDSVNPVSESMCLWERWCQRNQVEAGLWFAGLVMSHY